MTRNWNSRLFVVEQREREYRENDAEENGARETGREKYFLTKGGV